jgi:hypothetical protein
MKGSVGAAEGIEAAGGEEQYIPKRYNKETTLVAEVTGEENPFTMDFNLEK